MSPVHYPERLETFLPETQWRLYAGVISGARARAVPFAISGGFATSFITGQWRNTKDMDFCVLPQDRERMIEATREAGLHDLYDEKPYDRGWIYRATRDGVIVDIIWRMANYVSDVDDGWLQEGPCVTIYDETLRLVAAEEMIWSKIHIVQRDRCDWPDVINLIYIAGESLDWARLLARFGEDERLLGSVLALFAWVAPGRAARFPQWLWQRVGLQMPRGGAGSDDYDPDRVRRLDSRPWFTVRGVSA